MKKSKSQEILDDIYAATSPIDPEIIKKAFEKKLIQFEMDKSLFVDDVDVGGDGDITVTFKDLEEVPYVLLFSYDEQEGPQAFPILDNEEEVKKKPVKQTAKNWKGDGCKNYDDSRDVCLDDEDEEDEIEFDLAPFNPSIVQTAFGEYINLGDLSWLDYDTFCDMIKIAGSDNLTNESLNEIYRTVVKAGKRVRVNLVRRTRKRRLTPKQRAGIRRATLKRKREIRQTLRKRKRSTMLRKRLHLKPQHRPTGYKIGR